MLRGTGSALVAGTDDELKGRSVGMRKRDLRRKLKTREESAILRLDTLAWISGQPAGGLPVATLAIPDIGQNAECREYGLHPSLNFSISLLDRPVTN